MEKRVLSRLNLDTTTKLMFAIDLGKTSAKCAFSDLEGNIIERFIIKTSFGDEVIPNLYKGYRHQLQKLNIADDQIVVIGFGCKGVYDPETELIINAGGIGWFHYPANTKMNDLFHKPIIFTNDSRSAAVGEWKEGAGRYYKSFICITLGGGIGSGIILNNTLWTGAHNSAGEVGHGGMMQNIFTCPCGFKYCTEALSSGVQMEKLFNKRANEHEHSSLGNLQQKLQRDLLLSDLKCLIDQKDKFALAVLHEALQPLASRISLVIMLLDLDAVLIGGGASRLGDVLINTLKDILKTYLWETVLDKFDLKLCELGSDAGLIGVIEWTKLNFHDI